VEGVRHVERYIQLLQIDKYVACELLSIICVEDCLTAGKIV